MKSFVCIALLALLTSCSSFSPDIKTTADGCILVGSEFGEGENKQKAWVGICNDDRLVVEWESLQHPSIGDALVRATRYVSGEYSIEYNTGNGWAGWSSKSGIHIGPMPEPAAEFLPFEY